MCIPFLLPKIKAFHRATARWDMNYRDIGLDHLATPEKLVLKVYCRVICNSTALAKAIGHPATLAVHNECHHWLRPEPHYILHVKLRIHKLAQDLAARISWYRECISVIPSLPHCNHSHTVTFFFHFLYVSACCFYCVIVLKFVWVVCMCYG